MANDDVELNQQTNIPGTEKCLDFLFLAPYARTTRYEEDILPEGKKRPRSLRSLGLASLLHDMINRWVAMTCARTTRYEEAFLP